jgi:hypothetical protein
MALAKGSNGNDVGNWQLFLNKQGASLVVDGEFGANTQTATETFQADSNIPQTGVVGTATLAAAEALGYDNREWPPNPDPDGPFWPPKPTNLDSPGNDTEETLFGKFQFVPDPVPDDPEQIKILGTWVQDNIASVSVPQLAAVHGAPQTIQFNTNAVAQLLALWAEWESAGLLDLVLSWDGSFVPRFQRGSHTALSNHSFGSAFDINAPWNAFRHMPALQTQKGSTRRLVEIANRHGFYWGGHFSDMDGMHFEIAELIAESDSDPESDADSDSSA